MGGKKDHHSFCIAAGPVCSLGEPQGLELWQRVKGNKTESGRGRVVMMGRWRWWWFWGGGGGVVESSEDSTAQNETFGKIRRGQFSLNRSSQSANTSQRLASTAPQPDPAQCRHRLAS